VAYTVFGIANSIRDADCMQQLFIAVSVKLTWEMQRN
jgi:hypothetical protein